MGLTTTCSVGVDLDTTMVLFQSSVTAFGGLLDCAKASELAQSIASRIASAAVEVCRTQARVWSNQSISPIGLTRVASPWFPTSACRAAPIIPKNRNRAIVSDSTFCLPERVSVCGLFPAKDGCPTSRSFSRDVGYHRCTDPRSVSEGSRVRGKGRRIPYLAKNERDMGHPSFVRESRARQFVEDRISDSTGIALSY